MYKKKFTDKIEVVGMLGAARNIIERKFGEIIYERYHKKDESLEDLFIDSSDPSVVIYIHEIEIDSKRGCYVWGDKREVERLELMAKKFRFKENP